LITSLNPFIIYLNEEGLGRFCTEDYEDPSAENAQNVYMHLTNYHLNKSLSKLYLIYLSPSLDSDKFIL